MVFIILNSYEGKREREGEEGGEGGKERRRRRGRGGGGGEEETEIAYGLLSLKYSLKFSCPLQEKPENP